MVLGLFFAAFGQQFGTQTSILGGNVTDLNLTASNDFHAFTTAP